jgi:glycosyltransferase involved in cell wall biosynthesis
MASLSESQNEASSPKVSVIIPAYNASEFIREAINSVLNQTYTDYEIIVVDGRDGSTDNTREIVAEYGDAVRYFQQENTGLADARNKGILNAKGEYIAFLDSDDLWSENKLALQVEFLDSHRDVGLVFSDSWFKAYGDVTATNPRLVGRRFFQITKPHRGEVLCQLFVGNFIPVLTVVARKECLLKVGLFTKECDSAEDYDLWLRVSRLFKIDYIDEPLATYRNRGDSLVHKRDRLLSNLISIKKNVLENEPQLMRQFSRKQMNKIFYIFYFQLGNYFLFKDKHEKARGKYKEYLSLNPYNPRVYILLLMTFLPIRFKILSRIAKSLKMAVLFKILLGI